MRLVWTVPARDDLRALRAYVALDNRKAAKQLTERIVTMVLRLARFPEMGRPGRRDGTRQLVMAGTAYIVADRVSGAEIQVLRVLHSRRRWPEVF